MAERGLDYEDFLRQRGLPLWAPEDPRRKALAARRCATADAVASWVKEIHDTDPQNPRPIHSMSSIRSKYAAANAALVLIGVAVALLDRQIAAQADAFEKEGGFTERLYRVRQSRRRER